MRDHAAAVDALLAATLTDPFALLGPHPSGPGRWSVRALLPDADALVLIDNRGEPLATAERERDALFCAELQADERPTYRLQIHYPGHTLTADDPYRFGPQLGELDIHLLAEGRHRELYRALGAHPCRSQGVEGVRFALWAPNARRVAVVGDFNVWDPRRHGMRLRHGAGVWEIFIPGIGTGEHYKYAILDASGGPLPLKADPVASGGELRPANASVVRAPDNCHWEDAEWIARRGAHNAREAPISIYEVHAGSWRRGGEQGERFLNYRELAELLVPYALDMGFSHLQLMPLGEFPFDGSWGYQQTAPFAPTARHGEPADLQAFVQACHEAGLGVLLDWVPGHFPTDAHGLGLFDGTPLYEHADPRRGFHPDWKTLIYNFGRAEVANYLVASARHWLDRYHIDGLRVDAVASMLYLDYSRSAGQWLPNARGGRENLEAVALLQRTNAELYGDFPGIMTAAEESTAWPGVTRPTDSGGLGFGYKWNMGWMNDTLRYMARDPVHRPYHHNELTFGLMYAFDENFILPLSHDEVVHGKGSMIAKMPGDRWQQFANLRAYYGFMWAHPGKKLLFQGCEFAQNDEWSEARSLDWQLLDHPEHAGVQRLVRDLNWLYRLAPALHQRDCLREGFRWLEHADAARSMLIWERHGEPGSAPLVAIANFTPQPHRALRVGVPRAGYWAERINTDAAIYGGSGVGNHGGVGSFAIPWQGHSQSIELTVPPLATLILQWEEH